jgi:hypothetical protein
MLDRTNHHFSGRSPILFFNSGILTSLFWYTAIAHGKTMAWDCFLCHQPLCLQALILFGTTLWCYPYWYLRFPMDWWIRKYILVIGLKFFQKLLRLRCSLMNSQANLLAGIFWCTTVLLLVWLCPKKVLESVYLLSLLNQNDKKLVPIVFIISKIPIVINTDFRLLFLVVPLKFERFKIIDSKRKE